jgi:hypothetical protein
MDSQDSQDSEQRNPAQRPTRLDSPSKKGK